jgi:hypothetical protein
MRPLKMAVMFEQYDDAKMALLELRRRFPIRSGKAHLSVRSVNAPASEMRLSETDSVRAMVMGVAWGAAGGLLAAIGAALGRSAMHFDHATMLFAICAGVAIGIFGGGLFGSINPKIAMEQLRTLAGDGGVIFCVETFNEHDSREVERILCSHHGHLRAFRMAQPSAA